jgi:tetratricopeptide (TPR) repeat protein
VLVAVEEAALAPILEELGRVDEAEAMHRRALAAFVRRRRPYDVAVTANNLAALVAARGAHREAARLFARSLATKERLLGHGHPDVAMTLNNLAALRADMGDAREARRLQRRAVAIFARALGERHPKTRIARENLRAYQGALRPG